MAKRFHTRKRKLFDTRHEEIGEPAPIINEPKKEGITIKYGKSRYRKRRKAKHLL